MNGRISIVVPSYQQGRFLAATLDSLLAQKDPDLEILVVDGGSRDESVAVIERYAPHLAWWVSEKDRGQSDAINKGFARATGEWLGWLNSDDLLLPGALATVREHIRAQPEIDWWTGSGHFISAEGQWLYAYGRTAELREPAQLSDWRTHWIAQPSTFSGADCISAPATMCARICTTRWIWTCGCDWSNWRPPVPSRRNCRPIAITRPVKRQRWRSKARPRLCACWRHIWDWSWRSIACA